MTMRRREWEQAGWEMSRHSKAPPVALDALTDAVLHYPGATGPITTLSPITYVQNLQRSYVTIRNYSIGYNWLYWPDGTEIEARGLDLRNAANAVDGDPTASRRTVSLCIVVGRQDPATGAQIEAVRRRVTDLRARTRRRIGIDTHRGMEPTPCPGAGISAQHAAGLFEPNTQPAIDPNPQQEDEPLYLIPPPPERPGGRWIVRTSAGYCLATSHDITDRIPVRPLTDVYRVQQYDEIELAARNQPVPATYTPR